MKRQLSLLCALLIAFPAFAQTPAQIVSRMEQEMSGRENDGIAMSVGIKVPLVGTMNTRTWTLGDKVRAEAELMGVNIITWSDGETEWTYNSKSNELEIEKDKRPASPENGDTSMFEGIADGYDVSIKKEDGKAWYLVCRKSRSNKDKDAPKTIELSVAKGTYYPLSLSTKASGVTMTITDISFGVDEKQVTFDIKDFPDAKVVDKRK